MATCLQPATLESFRVGSLSTIYYIPDFVSPDEQLRLLHQVNAAPISKWRSLKNRRLQNWGGFVHEKGLLQQELPLWLSALTGKIFGKLGLFPSPINHVLVNEYLPGQGIMSHQDGPAYFPVVAILSLGSPAIMHFSPHPRLFDIAHSEQKEGIPLHPCTREASVILMPGSLLVFKDSAYEDYLHGIKECVEHNVEETVVNLDKIWLNRVNGGRLKPHLLPGFEDSESGQPLKEQDKRESFHLKDLESSEPMEYAEEDSASGRVFGRLKRNGTRVSLTCRVVTRVHRNFVRLNKNG